MERAGKAAQVDRVSLLGLTATARHGVLPAERQTGQRFVVDLVLGLDTTAAASSDDLADTVDYGRLAVDVEQCILSDSVNLLETLAQRVADRCLSEPRVEWVDVTVHKPEAPIAVPFADVAVTIHRSRP